MARKLPIYSLLTPALLSLATHTLADTAPASSASKPVKIETIFSLDTKDKTTGAYIVAVGDVNADGVNDYAIALPQARVNASKKLVKAGRLLIYSGATHSLLQPFDGLNAKEQFGYAAVGNVDINGDCIADIIISAPFANNKAGRVEVIYGSSGEMTREVLQQGTEREQLGLRLALGEIELTPKIYAAAPAANAGKLKQVGKLYRLSAGQTPVTLLQGQSNKTKLGSQISAFGNLLAVTQNDTAQKRQVVNVYRNEGLLQTFVEAQANSGFGEAISFGTNPLGASIAISAPKMKKDKQSAGAVMSIEYLGKAAANSAAPQWHYGLQANSRFGASTTYIEYDLLIAAPMASNRELTPQKPQAGML